MHRKLNYNFLTLAIIQKQFGPQSKVYSLIPLSRTRRHTMMHKQKEGTFPCFADENNLITSTVHASTGPGMQINFSS